MHKNFSYFGYFLFSILSIAIIAKLMNVWIVRSEAPVETPAGVCTRNSDCTKEICDPKFDSNNPNKDLYNCVCDNSECVWQVKNE